MNELDLSTLVLSWITTYGSPVVAGVLFLGALGLPLPCTLIVIATGAFVRQNFLDIYSTSLLGLVGTVGGDIAAYALGSLAHTWIQRRFGRSRAYRKAQDFSERQGGIAIYLTRWLLTTLALPVTLITGSSGYPFSKFLLLDVAGELTWIALYGGLGYAFGSQWEVIGESVSQNSGLILAGLVMVAGACLVVRWLKPVIMRAITYQAC
jgi:membrane-associated protein